LIAMNHDADRATLLQRERALYDAMIHEDHAALDALLAEDCTYIHSTGVEETKTEYLQGVRDGLYEYESIEAEEVRVRSAGGTAAVTGRVLMKVGERGRPKNAVPLLSTLVWISDRGEWRLWRRHATRIRAGDA
jgi:ketosteroid isomerase-like protein